MKEKTKINLAQTGYEQPFSGPLQNYSAGSLLDDFFSYSGGIPQAYNCMITGAPGVAKSTVTLLYAQSLQEAGYKVLYISTELTESDMNSFYYTRFPELREVPILYLQGLKKDPSDAGSERYTPEEAVQLQLKYNHYDVVCIDSVAEYVEGTSCYTDESRKTIETRFWDLIMEKNEKHQTSFLLIQQVNKSNTFSGSNRQKHRVHAMLELHYSEEENSGSRYLVFSKNRAGKNNQRLYYFFDNSGKLRFDRKRYEQELNTASLFDKEEALRKEEQESFSAVSDWNPQLNLKENENSNTNNLNRYE